MLLLTMGHEAIQDFFRPPPHLQRKNFVYLPQGTTGNLMDYPATPALADRYTALIKTQWDLINNPQST
ncbi:MAG: hypothetical protein PWR03_1779, partial [Tenuifilum sp.]|uniref:hypothetical protein n=1 Tax=Tenuifilum sp. TaxID=2760880 RepID=UPI0024AA4328